MSSGNSSRLSDSEVIAQLECDLSNSDNSESDLEDDIVLPTLENVSDNSESDIEVGLPSPNVGVRDNSSDDWRVYDGNDFPHFPYTLLGGYKEPIGNKPVST